MALNFNFSLIGQTNTINISWLALITNLLSNWSNKNSLFSDWLKFLTCSLIGQTKTVAIFWLALIFKQKLSSLHYFSSYFPMLNFQGYHGASFYIITILNSNFLLTFSILLTNNSLYFFLFINIYNSCIFLNCELI